MLNIEIVHNSVRPVTLDLLKFSKRSPNILIGRMVHLRLQWEDGRGWGWLEGG